MEVDCEQFRRTVVRDKYGKSEKRIKCNEGERKKVIERKGEQRRVKKRKKGDERERKKKDKLIKVNWA